MDNCPICDRSLASGDDIVTLRDKGCQGINLASIERDDTLHVESGQRVHVTCRRLYCNPNKIASDKKQQNTDVQDGIPSTRSQEPTFSFKYDCLFCGNSAKYSGKKKGFDVIPVRTKVFDESIKAVCYTRKDEWAGKVLSRLECTHDLHAADAVYHQQCSVNFRTNKNIPQTYHDGSQPKKRKTGRHDDEHRKLAFLKVVEYLEQNPEEPISIQDLINKMKNIHGDFDTDVYSFTFMKQKLLLHFGERIVISEVNGKPNVITFRTTASLILQEHYQNAINEDTEKEKLRLIQTASKLIKHDLKAMDMLDTNLYPSPDQLMDMNSNMRYLPESLLALLEPIFVEKDATLKLISIGQAIVQASRPRSLRAPLQLGLAVELHHHFASKFLIDTLSSHGFCSSYSEVKKFEYSAAATQGQDIPNLGPDMFVQFVADNVDHNVRTLDGLNTFHGMGIIATVTPGSFNRRSIPRMTVTAENIYDLGRIRMMFYNSPPASKLDMLFLPLEAHFGEDPTSLTDVLWNTVWLLRPMRPSWSGMMQAVHRGEYPGKSSVVFLPMIDMNSSDMSCVYSTLTFVSQQAQRYGITAILTFDQPLWWKATMIVNREQQASDLHKIVLRLGGLHILMSFLGCIGHLMTESGLQDVIEVVYASNAVGHILTGKAIARATRAHFLVDTAIHALLVSKEFDVTVPHAPPEHTHMDEEESAQHVPETDDCDMQEVCIMFDELMSDCVSLDSVQSSEALHKVKLRMQAVKEGLMNQRTARLWLQYLDMVHIIQRFIKGERTGNWGLHLKSMFDMLPYFAASGHHLYTKSVWLYLQCMDRLQEMHPEVHEMFQSGHHVVRRSDRYWGGLSSDLGIEQVLMRSMKTNGGLTRGTGMSETQRLVWLMSMPMCIDMSNAMQELTGVENQTSEQHKDTTPARLQRDTDDAKKILQFLTDRNPFEGNEVLRNIANGVTASKTVNVDEAKDCGLKILSLHDWKTCC